jgi:hypothetical protein
MAFIPAKDAGFAALADNLTGIVEAHLEDFHIPRLRKTPLRSEGRE